ncbi:MAG: MFS transporter [Patescibacteria group bacterium]|nr:MFS transporter [Patescibacteria group bacterium]
MGSTFLWFFRHKDFSKLWLSQISSQVAANMLTFALILHIYDLTKSLTTISLVMIASAIPSVILGPFSGVVTDKFRYKNVLIYTLILRFFVVLLLIPAAHNTLAILEIIFIMSAIGQFFAPAELSTIPLIIPKERLVGANSIYMTTMYGALIVGYGLAGPLQVILGSKVLFLLIAFLFALAAISVFSMSNFDKKIVSQIDILKVATGIKNVWAATKIGINYITKTKGVVLPMIKLAAGWAMLGAFIVVMPGFAEDSLGVSAKLAGPLLIVPAGFGMLISAYYLNKYKNINKSATINSSFVISGISLLVLSIYSYIGFSTVLILVAISLMIIMGFSAANVYISSQTILHINTESDMRGRVFGVSSMLINLALSLPALFVGGIADLTSPVFTMILVSVVVIIYGSSLFFE